jgi:hypothetical protein
MASSLALVDLILKEARDRALRGSNADAGDEGESEGPQGSPDLGRRQAFPGGVTRPGGKRAKGVSMEHGMLQELRRREEDSRPREVFDLGEGLLVGVDARDEAALGFRR